MTHTLHRQGNLKNDFVVMAHPATGINTKGSAEKVKLFIQLAGDFNPVNCGVPKAGNSISKMDEIASNTFDGCVGHVVFDCAENVIGFLKALKKENIGISIVVTGLFNDVNSCCREAALTPHTVNMSLGVYGKEEKLPAQEVLPITTMCGHAMVTEKQVNRAIKKIKEGKFSSHEAAEELAKPCVCGIFNIKRAASLLDILVKANES